MQPVQQLKIGLLNDLHYDGGVEAMNHLYDSVALLNRGGALRLVVMGDLIDAGSESRALRLLREVSALCDAFRGPVHYMPGNHDLDHISKVQFYEALGRSGEAPHFRFAQGGLEFVCIDGNFSPDGSEYDRGNFIWQDACVPPSQLAWIKEQLAASAAPVIVFSHQRIDKDCTHAIKNHAAVRDLLQFSGKVKAVFQGHQHEDDLQEVDGIAYYTLGAHIDDAGPAMVLIDARGMRLIRDFQPAEPA
jgi:alkaline phosphatase